ncbi:MAG: ATP-binding protein [Eubacteriales bacterium]
MTEMNDINNTAGDTAGDDGIDGENSDSPAESAEGAREFCSIRRLNSFGRRAIDEYGLINEGDRIAVGLSGGKDSMALLCMLSDMRRFYPKHFELFAITVDMGFEGMDFSPLQRFCESVKVPFKLIKTEISHIIFDVRQESNPCSLCARMRRGILHDGAVELGCNKLALGHHFDDVVETFMLNLFHEGRLGAFSPQTYLSRKNITMIRPLLYATEKDIRYFMGKNPDIPIVKNLCPEDEHTERETMKNMLADLDRSDKGLKHRIFTALQKSHIDGW